MPEYFEILLLVHIASAIIGFGPTYAFSILGPMAAKRGGPEAVTLMEGMIAIEKKLVIPAALLVQPLSGILLSSRLGGTRTSSPTPGCGSPSWFT